MGNETIKRQDQRRPKRPPTPTMIAREIRRVKVIGMRRAGMPFRAIAAAVGLKKNNVALIAFRAMYKGELTSEQYYGDGGPRVSDAEYVERWIAKLKARSTTNDKGCFIWTGNTNRQGYGQSGFRTVLVPNHRQMYRINHDMVELQTEQFVCHTCDERRCWNPDHLWLGTCADNQLDAVKKGRHYEAAKTHCDKGHPLSGDNLRITKQCEKSGRKGFRRACKMCERGRLRVKAGWPEALAYSLPAQPLGYISNPNNPADHHPRISHEQK